MRFKTPVIQIGSVKIGGNNPIAIQSMTNTDTSKVSETVAQCIELHKAGAELVRITVNDEASAKAVPKIRSTLNKKGFSDLPIIGDFHFNGHELLKKYPEAAKALDKYRINPGNVGTGKTRDKNFEKFIEIANKYKKPIRIGVNWGSLDQDLLAKMMDANAKAKNPKSDQQLMVESVVKSALSSARYAEKLGIPKNKIVLSVKMSDVQDVVQAYELLVKKMKANPYALHLGLTEAGPATKGIVSSSSALAILLQKGIGDTIRVSITPDAKTPRTEEVKVCQSLLQSLGLRHFSPQITSCPGCGRTNNQFFQKLGQEIRDHIEKNSKKWQKISPQVNQLRIAIMGCVVNGPGESKHADIGISLPGKGETPTALVFVQGKFTQSLQGRNIAKDFIKILEDYIKSTFRK